MMKYTKNKQNHRVAWILLSLLTVVLLWVLFADPEEDNGQQIRFIPLPLHTTTYEITDEESGEPKSATDLYFLITNPPAEGSELKELMLHFADTLTSLTGYAVRYLSFYEKTKQTSCFVKHIKAPGEFANIYLDDQRQDELGFVKDERTIDGIRKIIYFRTDKETLHFSRDTILVRP